MAFRLALGSALLVLASCAGGPAAGPASAAPRLEPPSREEGEALFSKGLEAARREDYATAVAHFLRARIALPTAANVPLNLGLAYAKDGRQILAIAWLKACLAAAPDAPNAPAVRAEIEKLTRTARQKAQALIDSAIAAADRLQGEPMKTARLQIAGSLARMGDPEQALRTLAKDPGPAAASVVETAFIHGLIEAEDFESAGARIDALPAPTERAGHWWGIVLKHLARGDEVGARNALKRAPQAPEQESEAGFRLARPRLDDGDSTPLEAFFPRAVGYYRGQAGILLVRERLERGDVDAALRIARAFPADSEGYYRARLLIDCGLRELEAGRTGPAQTLAREVLYLKDPGTEPLAAALLGNLQGAIGLIKAPQAYLGFSPFDSVWWAVRRDVQLGRVAYAQAIAGDLPGARRTAEDAAARALDKADDGRESWPEAYIAVALARKGQGDEALRWAVRPPPRVRSWALAEIARLRFNAGDLEGAAGCAALMPIERGESPEHRVTGQELVAARMRVHLRVSRETRSPEFKRAELRTAVVCAWKAGLTADPIILGLLREAAEAQERNGDPEGAAGTRALIPTAPAAGALDRALQMTRDDRFDLDHFLREEAKRDPVYLPGSIAWAAERMFGIPLRRLQR